MSQRTQRILVVDDEPDMVDILQLYLQDAGYEVITALSGLEAIRKAKSMTPDLILLDLLMTPVDGYEVMKELQEDQKACNIPIVILTAMGDTHKEKAFKMSAKGYITKPFTEKNLLREIKIVLGS